MKTCYCEECKALVGYRVEEPINEEIIVKDKSFMALQQHAYCIQCSSEVYPAEAVDFCVREAHDGYRIAVETIPVKRMEELLEKYNIGKGPLSKLLGWGANTIAREMKHCIPDREHAIRLESLFDPEKMKELLEKKRSLITAVAYKKAMDKVLLAIREHNSFDTETDTDTYDYEKATATGTVYFTDAWDELTTAFEFSIANIEITYCVEPSDSKKSNDYSKKLSAAA